MCYQMLSGAGWLLVHRVLFPTVLPLPRSPVLLLGSPWSWSGNPLDCPGGQVNITPTILAKLKVRNSTNPQGHMLAASSNCDTVSRNCGVFWSIFQIAPALAALLVWALWGGEEESGTVKYRKCWRYVLNFFFLLLTRSWELFFCMHKPLSSCLVSWPPPCLVSPSPAAPPFCSSPSPTTE